MPNAWLDIQKMASKQGKVVGILARQKEKQVEIYW